MSGPPFADRLDDGVGQRRGRQAAVQVTEALSHSARSMAMLPRLNKVKGSFGQLFAQDRRVAIELSHA